MKWLNAQKEFESYFPGKGFFIFEFHDSRIAKGTGGSNRIFTTSHPSDYIVVANGHTFFAEVKSSQEKVSFPFSNIKKSQWSAAKQTVAAKGHYYFFLKNENTQNWYRVPAQVLIAVLDSGVKSIRWDLLNTMLWRPTL